MTAEVASGGGGSGAGGASGAPAGAARRDRAERPRRSASWALAARLARREVRRRKGRTALVVALIAIPVMAMTIASVGYRTMRDSADEFYVRQFGASDMALYLGGGTNMPIQEVRARLPEGTREIVVNEINDYVTPADGGAPTHVRFTSLPLADPITDGIVRVSAGRVPAAGAAEVLLSPDVARALDVDVGDTLRLEVPNVSYQVVGLGRATAWLDAPLMVPGRFDIPLLITQALGTFSLIDLPDGVTAESLGFTKGVRGDVATPSNWGGWYTAGLYVAWGSTSSGTIVAWGWVAGALALTVMGIIIAAAFATSARRQLVTLGQLGSNGADRKLLQRTLALQGAWSGLIGAVVGVVLGIVLILPQHGFLERLADHSLGSMTVAVSDLLVILVTGVAAATVAALVPSRAAAKVPVLEALGGRRPLGLVPRWLVPTGLALFAGGLAAIALSAAVQGAASGGGDGLVGVVALVGGLGVLFGMCCATPAIVAVLGPMAERLTGTARVAARSIARTRTRTAAIVTAIAAAGALSIGGGTAIATRWDRDPSIYSSVPYLRPNIVSVEAYDIDYGDTAVSADGDQTLVDVVPQSVPASTLPVGPQESTPPAEPVYDAPAPVFPPVPADVQAGVAAIVPDAEIVPVRRAAFDPAPSSPATVFIEPDRWNGSSQFVIADPALLDAIQLSSRDRGALERAGVLAQWQPEPSAERRVTADTQTGPITFDVASMRDFPAMWAYAQYPLITPAKAAELGLLVGSNELLFVAPDSLRRDQRSRLIELAPSGWAWQGSAFRPPAERPTEGYSINVGGGVPYQLPRALADGLIVGGALLFVLAVVVVGLALSAAESRDERDVLLAVGASPQAMRQASAQKAMLLAAIGGVLAVPTGFLPVAVVLAQVNDDPIRFPWVVALGCVAVVPGLVGGATFAGSALAQRLRPVRMSTLATD